MPSRFLSDEQRARYGRYAGDPTEEQLARHFHLDATDRELVGRMRGAHNRVGFAVQLGTARFLGAFLDDPTHAPSAVIATIARQLSEMPAPSLDAYRDGRQRWRHIAMIRERYGFRDLEEDTVAGFRLTRWLYVLCWTGDDRPGLLFDRATTWLLAHKVLLPGITTLERLISRVRYRATLRSLAPLDLCPDRRAATEARRAGHVRWRSARHAGRSACCAEDAGRRRSCCDIWSASMPFATTARAWRHPPTCRRPRSARLARSARISKPANLAALHEPRRTATLAALFQTLEAIALDDAVELFDALATDIFALAEEAHRKSRLRSLRDLDAAAIMLRDLGQCVIADEDDCAFGCRLAGCAVCADFSC